MATPRPEREPEIKDRYRDQEERAYEEREPEREFPERPSPSIVKANRILNYFFVVFEGLIAIRILLKVLGGNPANAFVNFIYSVTYPFVYPFLTVFNWQTVSTGIGLFEFGAVLAIAFYILLNYAIVRLIWILSSRA